MLILSIFCINIIYTKALYKTKNYGQIDIKVASPKIRLINQITNINELDLNTYINEFKVVNFDENGNFSDVKMNYILNFEMSDKNAPIDIKLYKIDVNGNESQIPLNENMEMTSGCLMQAEKIQEDKYKLKIKYNFKNTKMNNDIDLKINLKSIQEL